MKNLLLIVMMGVGLMTHSQLEKKEYFNNIIAHAVWQSHQDVTYDESYREIQYPMGDVPSNIGVCTDVIIRAYRAINVDLQVLVHESVKKNHKYYYPNPLKGYGLHPDANIDHRRVRILKKFFKLHYPESELGQNDFFEPGDIVFWDNWHIGILIDKRVPGTDRFYCVHNIGSGPVIADVHYNENNLEHFRFKP